MRVWASRYELIPRAPLNARSGASPRSGALIRIGDGFADLHPWPELGDAPLDEQLRLLADGTPTELAKRAVLCTTIDGEARATGYSLFDDAKIPRSHYSAGGSADSIDFELLADAGFDRVKIKAGRDASEEVESLARATKSILVSRIRLRIDFNAGFGVADVHQFLDSLPSELLPLIEFLEDPTPADAKVWTEIRLRWGIPIAADREKPHPSAWDVAVFKPAWEDDAVVERAIEDARTVVVTSAMDHPLGQVWAASRAADLSSHHPGRIGACGLLTHHLYEKNAFSERLATVDGVLVPPGGNGLGFDDLLESLSWKKLA